MTITFTEADIRAGANSQSFSRGYEYYNQGAVSNLVRRGDLLTAEVAGSQYEPYEVLVTLGEDGDIVGADCSCPYDWGGYCKHVVAVLLAALDEEEEVTVKPDVEALLADLSEAQLRGLIRALVEEQPRLIETIERALARLKMSSTPGAATPAAAAIAVDLAAIHREIRKDFRQAGSTGGGYGERYWDDEEEGTIYPDKILGPHRELARRLLEAGDAARATDVIGAMIEEWGRGVEDLEEWLHEANEDAFAETEGELGALLVEALLSLDLSAAERQQWLETVKEWGKVYFDLEPAEVAMEQWWDYPPLVAAMQGQIDARGMWGDDPPEFASVLTQARLRVLERQGRTQEYIHLAEAEGETSLHVNMLARNGEVERAVDEARRYLVEPSEVLALAQILAAQGQPAAALAVADHGLGTEARWRKDDLAHWTAKLAQQQGDGALALRAAQVAFGSSNALADFKLARELAGAEWLAVKRELLAGMEASHHFNKAEIYLAEGMLVEAMAVIDREPYSSGLEQVIQATRTEYPEWGIGKCRRRAEAIIDAGKSNHYDEAVGWLRTARDIYRQHGRQAEWSAYLSGLLEKHGRKYKLVPMLREIG